MRSNLRGIKPKEIKEFAALRDSHRVVVGKHLVCVFLISNHIEDPSTLVSYTRRVRDDNFDWDDNFLVVPTEPL